MTKKEEIEALQKEADKLGILDIHCDNFDSVDAEDCQINALKSAIESIKNLRKRRDVKAREKIMKLAKSYKREVGGKNPIAERFDSERDKIHDLFEKDETEYALKHFRI